MVGAYKPCAEFIKLARMIKLDAVFVNISFAASPWQTSFVTTARALW
jgi:hypothetical protein